MQPSFGGAERIYNLAHSLGPVTVLSLSWDGVFKAGQFGDLAYRQIGVDAEAREQSVKLLKLGVSTYDGMPHFTAKNQNNLRAAIEEENPNLIILEHPWLIDFVGDTPFVYDAHNAEALLTQSRWPNSIDAQAVFDLERRAVTQAKAITVCSEDDAKVLAGLYKTTVPMHLIPNGTDLPDTLSEGKTKNLLFIGSNYGPNIRAAQELANLANQLPDYIIQIVGACVQGVVTNAPNVQLIGPVSEEAKHNYFLNAYAFVNLMLQGSGTNLKNARAMAYGLPVIATPIGARGFPTAIQIKSSAEVGPTLASLSFAEEQKKNRAYAETISWQVVGEAFSKIVKG
jgi:glycosyltransferase involved in cell wall biosynthesis